MEVDMGDIHAAWTLDRNGWCVEADVYENQRLIQSTPDLLAALIEERRIRTLGQRDDVHWESMRDMRRTCYAATDAAIARATELAKGRAALLAEANSPDAWTEKADEMSGPTTRRQLLHKVRVIEREIASIANALEGTA
jgi:hypothetical protein